MARRSRRQAVTQLTSAEIAAISASAVKEVVDELQEKQHTPSYTSLSYANRSQLDAIAVRAMQQEQPHLDTDVYLKTARKAVRDFLGNNPSFLQPNTFHKPYVVSLA